MSIGEFANWAATTLITLSAVASIVSLVAFGCLVRRRPRPGRRRPWFAMFIAAFFVIAFGFLALGLPEVLESEPPFPLG